MTYRKLFVTISCENKSIFSIRGIFSHPCIRKKSETKSFSEKLKYPCRVNSRSSAPEQFENSV